MNIKQKKFADHYIELGNATEAAIIAGYSKKTARTIASQLLTKVDIKEYIEDQLKKIEDQSIAKSEEVLKYLTRILRDQETEEVIVVRSCGNFETEIEVVNKKISAKDKIKAAHLLGKRYKLFTDKVEADLKELVVFINDEDIED